MPATGKAGHSDWGCTGGSRTSLASPDPQLTGFPHRGLQVRPQRAVSATLPGDSAGDPASSRSSNRPGRARAPRAPECRPAPHGLVAVHQPDGAGSDVALYDQGYTVEAAPLMRNLLGHSYAMDWLANSGEPAVVALTDYWNEHRRKLAQNVNETWNLPEPAPRLQLSQSRSPTLRASRSTSGWSASSRTSTPWSRPTAPPTSIRSTGTSRPTRAPRARPPTPS